jgi:hypothetical protein
MWQSASYCTLALYLDVLVIFLQVSVAWYRVHFLPGSLVPSGPGHLSDLVYSLLQ